MIRRLLAVSVFLLACAQAQQLSGIWEGPISFQRRPIIANIDFASKAARLDITGSQTLPLDDLRSDGRQLHFVIQIDDSQVLTFDGTLRPENITGQVELDDEKVSFALKRLPDLPKPKNRIQAWQQDLDAALSRFLQYDLSFSPPARQKFRHAIARLRTSIGRKSDPEIIVGLARAVALSGNAHTRLYLLRNRTELRRYPVRLWWFSDGLYVVRATPEHRRAIGCRLLKIGGLDPRKVYAAVQGVFAGNNSWHDYMTVYSMTSPEVLYGSGLIRDMENAQFTFGNCSAGRFTATLHPLPFKRSTVPVEAWHDLAQPRSDQAFVAAGLSDRPGPLYLRHPELNYWLEYLERERVLYINFFRAQDQRNESLADFNRRVFRVLDQHPQAAVIVDLRFNTGGNLGIGRQFVDDLGARLARVYVITGRATFSAGLFHAAQLKQTGKAVLVGEPVADVLSFWSEGGNVVLPNSGLAMHYANAFHNYSKTEYPDRRSFVENLGVATLAPDIPVRLSSRHYFDGRDPAMEAVLAHVAAAAK